MAITQSLGFNPDMSDASESSRLFSARGSAAQFEAGKYNVSNFQYPEDLMSNTNEYGGNYAVFFINVSTDSKLIKPGAERAETVANATPRYTSAIVGQAQYQNLGTGSVGVFNSALSTLTYQGVSANNLEGLLDLEKLKESAVKGVATGVAVTALEKLEVSNFQGQQKRLKTAISLHMPNQMNTRYSVQWDEKDTMVESMALGAIAGGIDTSVAASKAFFGTGSVSSEIMDGLSNASGGAAAVGLSLPGQSIMQKLSGMAPNPRKEQLFKQVDFRTFQFTYEFWPRSEKEAQNVQNIINTFKYHMHPEYKDTMNFLYVYPSEFDIFYYHGSQENLKVNRHTSCVLTEMNINYAPQGQFTTFPDGTPTQINVTLTFKELATLTKEKIEDGL